MHTLVLLACTDPDKLPFEGSDTGAAETDTVPEKPRANCLATQTTWDWDEIEVWVSQTQYDADENLVSYLYDDEPDERFEEGTTTSWVDGRIDVIEVDTDDRSNDVDARQSHAYEAELLMTYWWDGSADGTDDIEFTLGYDDYARRVLLNRDEDLDGTFEAVWITTWTADGTHTIEWEEYDSDYDDLVDATEQRLWNADGETVAAEYDSDADGSPESVHTYTYDGGSLQYHHGSYYEAGAFSYEYQAGYSYDTLGRFSGWSTDYYLDGYVDYTSHVEYDCDG